MSACCDHIEGVHELAEFDEPSIAEAQEVGDVKAQRTTARTLLERDVRHDCRPVAIDHGDLRHVAFQQIVLGNAAQRFQCSALALVVAGKRKDLHRSVDDKVHVVGDESCHPFPVAARISGIEIGDGGPRGFLSHGPFSNSVSAIAVHSAGSGSVDTGRCACRYQ